MISPKELRQVLDYNADTGVFVWKKQLALRGKRGSEAGCVEKKARGGLYRRIRIHGILYYAHRLAWLYAHGEEAPEHIDHVNNNGLDNRIDNLRAVSCSANQHNKRISTNNTSGANGVKKSPHGWIAQIVSRGQSQYLGTYRDWHDAVYARYYTQLDLGFEKRHGV